MRPCSTPAARLEGSPSAALAREPGSEAPEVSTVGGVRVMTSMQAPASILRSIVQTGVLVPTYVPNLHRRSGSRPSHLAHSACKLAHRDSIEGGMSMISSMAE